MAGRKPGSLRRSEAAGRARRHLLACLEQARQRGLERLPGIRRLAAEAGVAHVTMWKAVRTLADEGLLTTGPERATRPNPLPSCPAPGSVVRVVGGSSPPASGSTGHWRVVHDQLVRDMLQGALPPDSRLPSLKELRVRFGAGHATLSRALEVLVAEGYVERHGRGCRVRPTAPAGAGFTTVVFVGRARQMDMFTDLSARAQELWRCLESGSARAGLRLEVRSMEDCLGGSGLSPGGEPGVVAGYVVRHMDLPAEQQRELVGVLGAQGRPVALVDETGDAPPARAAPAARRLLRRFSIAHGDDAGREAGRFLLMRGHRECAFVTPYHAAPWSRNRLAGLAEAVGQAGDGASLRVYDPGVCADDFALRDHAFAHPATRRLLSAVAEFHRDMRGAGPFDAEAYRRDPAFQHVLARTLEDHLRPVVARALDSGATAWVCASDPVALAVLRLLAERDAAVPADISVMGFDNSPEAMVAGLTSYDFNVPALADALLRHVLDPLSTPAHGRGSVELPGYVVERVTTARCGPVSRARPVRPQP